MRPQSWTFGAACCIHTLAAILSCQAGTIGKQEGLSRVPSQLAAGLWKHNYQQWVLCTSLGMMKSKASKPGSLPIGLACSRLIAGLSIGRLLLRSLQLLQPSQPLGKQPP